MTDPENRELIPLNQLRDGMRVKTPDGQYHAVVEIRDRTEFFLRYSVFGGGNPPNAPIPFGFDAGIELISDEITLPEDLNLGQLNLLNYLLEAGPNGVTFQDMAGNSNTYGYTPDDQADLVIRGLWATRGGKIIHPNFVADDKKS